VALVTPERVIIGSLPWQEFVKLEVIWQDFYKFVNKKSFLAGGYCLLWICIRD